MRVFISACGEGLGHTARILALHDALKRKGHEAVFAGYGNSLKIMKARGLETIETFPEVRMVGKNGRFDIISSIINSSGTPLDLMKSYMVEKQAMANMNADAVIGDSRLSTMIAGATSRLPTFYITNQSEFKLPSLHISETRRIEASKILSKARLPAEIIRKMIDVPLSTPYSFADRLLIPDFKPPETICLPLLSRDIEIKKKTYFVGPMNELCYKRIKKAGWESKKTKVLVTFGGQGFRAGLIGEIVKVARRIGEFEFMVVSLFLKKDVDIENLKLRRFLPDIAPYAAAADFLVIPGGHSSIIESILLEKPAIVIPDKGQAEQESNAARYQQLGLGTTLSIDALGELEGALKKLEANEEHHKERLAALSERAKRSENGAKNTVEMIERFVERIRY